LQPKDIVGSLKAAIGDTVLTPFGKGKVKKYRHKDGVYEIILQFGAMLFAPAEAFVRASATFESSISRMHWVLSFSGGRGNDAQELTRSK